MTVILSNKVDDQEPWDDVMLRGLGASPLNKTDAGVPWDDVMLRVVAVESNLTDSKFWPYPIQGGVRARYNQRCVDTVTLEWVAWATYYQDVYGNEYPGAGFDSATYKVESIIHDREQG